MSEKCKHCAGYMHAHRTYCGYPRITQLEEALQDLDLLYLSHGEDGCPVCHTRIVHHETCVIGQKAREVLSEPDTGN